MTRVSWIERKTNVWVLENIKPERTLESRVAQADLRYFGHVYDGLSREILHTVE